jgi:glutaconate CoA-transferase subunit B
VLVITDLGVLEPDPSTCELTLTRIHPGVNVADVRAQTGWPLVVGEPLTVTSPPTETELAALRSLIAAGRSGAEGGGSVAAD